MKCDPRLLHLNWRELGISASVHGRRIFFFAACITPPTSIFYKRASDFDFCSSCCRIFLFVCQNTEGI